MAILMLVALAASVLAVGLGSPAGASQANAIDAQIAVAKQLFSGVDGAGNPGECGGSTSSSTTCPATSELQAAFTHFSTVERAGALCRCQNTPATISYTTGGQVPNPFNGKPGYGVVDVRLGFNPPYTVSVLLARQADGTWLAVDTYCAASPGDPDPYANRMTENPQPCVGDPTASPTAPTTSPAAGYLNGVSCPSTKSCFAVGDSPLTAEHWNGTNWSILTIPDPEDIPTASVLKGVSCPSMTNCFAVGWTGGSSVATITSHALVEHWNGSSWSKMTNPHSTGVIESGLYGVSCPTTTSCFAVGTTYGVPVSLLAEHWDGTSWSDMTIPTPAGTAANLSGVSCPTTSSCFAVGTTTPTVRSFTSFSSTLVEHWDGTSWSIATSPNPIGLTNSSLSGVSCPSATSCFAVGGSAPGGTITSPATTLVEHWDGTSWSIMTTPVPAVHRASLSGVSCPSTTSCFAVGTSVTTLTAPEAASPTTTLVERWNGTDWSILASANPVGLTNPSLWGVSCPSATSCSAVGTSETGRRNIALVERWNGTSWSIMSSATAPPPKTTTSPAATAALPAALGDVVGTWQGEYTCSQGRTGLELVVSGSDPAALTARFSFGPLPANPSVPRGEFEMMGSISGHQVTLTATKWTVQPSGYGLVGLTGEVAGSTFSGTVQRAGCTNFTLTKLRVSHAAASLTRSQLVESILTPGQVSFAPKLVGENALLALLFVFLVALPSTIFNSTLTANYGRVTRRFRRVRVRHGRVETSVNHLPGGVLLVGFSVVGALIYGFLDPEFGFNQTTLVLVGALAVALIVVTGFFELLRVMYLQRRRRRARLVSYPLALVMAIILVALSRLGHIQPGYVFGLTCALVYVDPVAEPEEGRSIMLAALTLLGISFAAWFAWIPVHDAASVAHPGVSSVFFDAVLATIWICGLQSIIFGLLPMRFLYGEKLAAWSWIRWFAVYGLTTFIFVHVLVHPSSGRYGGSPHASLLSMLVPFFAFTAFAVAFWGWFRLEDRRRPLPTFADADDSDQSSVTS